MSYDEAKRLQAIADARRAELDLAERCGALVSVERVRATLARRYSAAREVALNLPSRLSVLLASESDPETIHQLLADEMHRFLSHLVGVPGYGHPKAEDADL
jgi:hypothetical protein